jgi:hypothetical protein
MLIEVDPAKPKKEASGRVVPMDMSTALVQSRFQPRESLITMMAGSIFSTTWFFQVGGTADAPKPQQLEQDAPWQQYERVNNYETRLQGDLSFSYVEESGDRTVTGTLQTYPGRQPNVGDPFLADAGDGRVGHFEVTNVEPLTWMNQACYSVQFVLKARNDPIRLADLEKKTVETFQFVTDFIRFGKNPVLIDSLYQDYRTLFRTSETMIGEYMRLFFSEVSQTLMIPGQATNCYDPFLVSAVLGVLETTEHPLLRKVSAHNTDAQYAFRTTTIWDALLQMEPSHIHLSCQRLGLATKAVVRTRANYGGAYWAQIDHIMFPMEAREDVDAMRTGPTYTATHRLDPGPAPVRDFNRLIREKDTTSVRIVEKLEERDRVVNIHDVTVDDYYVFSKAFYEEDAAGMSHLEKLVWAVLNQGELDVPKLAQLVRQSKYWDKLERFYYVPVLMILCILAMRGPSI